MNEISLRTSEPLVNIPANIPTLKTPKIGRHQLLVLGNGFDLECGLPTRFCHFFEPRIEALKAQDWKATGKLEGLGYEATPTLWDFLLRSKLYAPWYSIEDAVNDLVLSAGDGASGPTGLAKSLIECRRELATESSADATGREGESRARSDEEDLLRNVAEFMAADCSDALRQPSQPWSSKELIDYLGMQLAKIESNFSNYMCSICEGNDVYAERSLKLLRWMLADGRPAEENLILNTTVLSFNYTNPFKETVRHSGNVNAINVHTATLTRGSSSASTARGARTTPWLSRSRRRIGS